MPDLGRIWDIENKRKQTTVIVVKSKERGARTKISSCAYSHDGGLIAGGEIPIPDSRFQIPNQCSKSRSPRSWLEFSIISNSAGSTHSTLPLGNPTIPQFHNFIYHTKSTDSDSAFAFAFASGSDSDSDYIRLACYDGAVHLWSTSSNFVRPNMSMETAHGKGTETGSIVLSMDGRTLLTRGGDDTVKSELTSCPSLPHLSPYIPHIPYIP